MTLDERIRENLKAAATSVETTSPTPVGDIKSGSSRRRAMTLGRWTAIGAVAVAALVLGVTQLGSSGLADGEPATSTFPGMPVSGEFEIKLAQSGPFYQFTTNDLGSNVSISPFETIDEAVVDRVTESIDGRILQVELIGTLPDGTELAVTNYVQSDAREGEIQYRCLNGSCYGGEVEDYGDEPHGLVPQLVSSSPSVEIQDESQATLTWELPNDVSVAMFTDGEGERFWARPVGGIAVFKTEWSPAYDYRLTMFDESGGVMGSHLEPAQEVTGFHCPVTLPTSPDFSPPDGYPETARVGQGWFGTADLWTVLPVDGAYDWRKSVWWSENFPGGAVEEDPPITVRWDRLDEETEPITISDGTNAHTDEDGWFMIAGIDPDVPGCWEVTAEYKGETLSYVYEQS